MNNRPYGAAIWIWIFEDKNGRKFFSSDEFHFDGTIDRDFLNRWLFIGYSTELWTHIKGAFGSGESVQHSVIFS